MYLRLEKLKKEEFIDFDRKIINEFMLWKDSLKTKRKALIIKGLRQIGKTYIVKKFAEENYDNVILIDFKKEPSLKKYFAINLNVDDLVINFLQINRVCFLFHIS